MQNLLFLAGQDHERHGNQSNYNAHGSLTL